MTWKHSAGRRRWEWRDRDGRVTYWISDQAVGTAFDSEHGFVSTTGEQIPPLPDEAYA